MSPIDKLINLLYNENLKETLSKKLSYYFDKNISFLRSHFTKGLRYIQTFIDSYNQVIKNTINSVEYSDHFDVCCSCLILYVALLDTPINHNFIIEQAEQICDQLNAVSDGVKIDKHIDINQIKLEANALRKTNKNLPQRIIEHKLSQFDTSKITDKSISQYGLNEAKLINATFGNDSITLQFEVESTGDNTHVDLTGKTQVFLKRGYSVTVQFNKTKNYLSPTNINQNGIAQQFNSVIQNCDAKVYCDCPAFYWQGMAEKDAKQGDSYFGFKGQHGTGYWNKLHNVNGPQACKHIWSAIYFINTEQKQICDKLLSHVVDSSKVYNNIINQN